MSAPQLDPKAVRHAVRRGSLACPNCAGAVVLSASFYPELVEAVRIVREAIARGDVSFISAEDAEAMLHADPSMCIGYAEPRA